MTVAFDSREGRILAHSILSTADPGQIGGILDASRARRLGSRVEETDAARGAPCSRRETIVATGACSARFEHAVDTEGEDLRGGFREALSRYGEEYLCA